jgi:aconitate hydratase
VGALAPGSTVTATFSHADGSTDTAQLKHTLNAEQVEWFQAGGALSLLAKKGNRSA